jgi:ribonuclease HI
LGTKVKYYVVWKGHTPGVYNTWEECCRQVNQFAGAVYRSFPTRELAEKAYAEESSKYIGTNPEKTIPEEQKQLIGFPITRSICVDASMQKTTGLMEYRGVDARTGKEIFRGGPYPEATNNLGEFLALVHALALLKKKDSDMPVYSDSRTAISWVKKKSIGTKLQRTHRNEKLFSVVEKALDWVKNHDYPNRILKWETEIWGENPADFGRK